MKSLSILLVCYSLAICGDCLECKAQIISLPRRNEMRIFSHILSLDTQGRTYFFEKRYFKPLNVSRIVSFEFKNEHIVLDTIIEGIINYPKDVMSSNIFPFRINDNPNSTYIKIGNDTISIPFKIHHIYGLDVLSNGNILFVNEYEPSNVKSLSSLVTPFGFYIYSSKPFRKINSGQFEPALHFFYYKGMVTSKNYWAVVFDTYSAGKNAMESFRPFIGDTLSNYYGQLLKVPQFYNLSIYDNDGKFVKYQSVETPQIFFKKQTDCFLTISENKNKIGIWQMNDKEVLFKKVHEINSKGFNVLDYSLYNGFLYVLLGNKSRDQVLFKKIDLSNYATQELSLQYFDHVDVNQRGIFLYYSSNHLEGLAATKKAIKNKKLFHLTSDGRRDFSAMMYYNSIIARFDQTMFDASISDTASVNLEIDFDKQETLDYVYLLPCKLNGEYKVWISYFNDTMYQNQFHGVSIRVGELGYFYLPEKKALWDRRTGKVIYHIGDLNAALEKSLALWSKNSKIAKIYVDSQK